MPAPWRLREPADLLLVAAMAVGAAAAVLLRQPLLLAAGPLLLLLRAGLKDSRHVWHLLLFSIPLSAEVQLTEFLGTDLPDEPLMWLLCVLLLLDFPARRTEWLHRPVEPLLAAALLLHLGWVLTATLLSEYPLLSLKYTAAKLWYVVACGIGAWRFLREPEDFRRAARTLCVSMSLAVAYVLSRHALTGFTFESANASVEPIFRNHVNYAALLVCLLPCLYAARRLPPPRARLLPWLMALWCAGLYFSYSRGAWLAAAAGILTVTAMRRKALGAAAAAALLALLLAGSWLSAGNRYLDFRPDYDRTIFHGDLGSHMRATYQLKDISTAERFHRWIAALRMSEGHLLHGYGPNSFYHEYKPYTVSAFRTYVSDNPEKSTVHNYFLLLLVEQGLPGLLAFCLLLAAMFRAASRAYHATADPFRRTVAATVVAMLSSILLLNGLSDLIETDKVGSLFFICLGILLQGEAPGRRAAA